MIYAPLATPQAAQMCCAFANRVAVRHVWLLGMQQEADQLPVIQALQQSQHCAGWMPDALHRGCPWLPSWPALLPHCLPQQAAGPLLLSEVVPEKVKILSRKGEMQSKSNCNSEMMECCHV